MSAAVTEDIKVLIETVEALQAVERKQKARIALLEQQLVAKEAETESLRMLPNENQLLRDESAQLREKILELERTASRAVELGSLGAESTTQVSVKLQAFQRHNHFLQGELATRDAKIRTMQERMDVLGEELQQKERRCSVLTEKIRQLSIDPQSVTANHIQVPEELFAQMKHKVASQAQVTELLQERVETLQEEAQRRELLVEALQRENAALRQSVSRLIAQVNGVAPMEQPASQLYAAGAADGKLRAYRNSKATKDTA